MEEKKSLKSGGIPSWQLAESSTTSDDQSRGVTESSLPMPPTSPDTLLKQAATFLLDDNVRSAPLERKRSFLQSKGLSIDEIDQLLQNPTTERFPSARTEDENQISEVKSGLTKL